MASIEKLVKSLEALKVLQTPVDKPEEALVSAKFIKKEPHVVNKKEKIGNLNSIAEIICTPNLRGIEDFQKFLGISIETFLACIDDADQDVRSCSEYCLNRTIKTLIDTHLGRIQVELYKEIKKNGSSRVLRAALSRFADLAHLIRPSKCRPYVVNLWPCILKIIQRTDDELIQETLQNSLLKILPVLAIHANEVEIQSLLQSFIPNLQNNSLVVRRTAATCLAAICEHSKKKDHFYSWLMKTLLDQVATQGPLATPSDATPNTGEALLTPDVQAESARNRVLVGALLCFKTLVPKISTMPTTFQNASFHESMHSNEREKELYAKNFETIVECTLHFYELSLYCLQVCTDNVLIMSSLEALVVLLRDPPQQVLSHLCNPKGIPKSRLVSQLQDVRPTCLASPGLSSTTRSIACSSENIAILEAEDEMTIKKLTLRAESNDQPGDSEMEQPAPPKPNGSSQTKEEEESIADDRSEAASGYFDFSTSTSQFAGRNIETLDTSSISSPMHLRDKKAAKLMRMNFADSEETAMSMEVESHSPRLPSADNEEESISYSIGNIGKFTDDNISSLEFCCRVIASRFLLAGTRGNLIPDRSIRVSLKALAMTCVASAVSLHPKCYFITLFINEPPGEQIQRMWDLSLYRDHGDPNLRGQVAILLGGLLSQLVNDPQSYNQLLNHYCDSSFGPPSDSPSLEQIVDYLIQIVDDKKVSSSALRLGVMAIQQCLSSLLIVDSPLNGAALKLIDVLLEKSYSIPHWLVKADILDLFTKLPYEAIHYLEKSRGENEFGLYSSNSPRQEQVIQFVFKCLMDEDPRVRQNAAQSLSNLLPNLFFPEDHIDGDPLCYFIRGQVDQYLKEFSGHRKHPESTLFSFDDYPFPTIDIMKECIKTKYNKQISRTLRRILLQLMERFIGRTHDKRAINGFCYALYHLSSAYPVIIYPNAWGWSPSSSNRSSTSHPSSRNSQSSSHYSGFKLADLLVALLNNCSALILDIQTHEYLMRSVSRILHGFLFHELNSLILRSDTLGSEEFLTDTVLDWRDTSGKYFNARLLKNCQSFMSHLLKILTMYSIIESPAHSSSSSSTASSSTLSSASSLASSASKGASSVIHPLTAPFSPIKKKSKSFSASDRLDVMSFSKKLEPEDNSSTEKRVHTSHGEFSLDPLYYRLFHTLKGAHSSSKIKMDNLVVMDKSKSFLVASLDSLSMLLEFAPTTVIAPIADDLLRHMKNYISYAPEATVNCVRKMLKSIFGINLASLSIMKADLTDKNPNNMESVSLSVDSPSAGSFAELLGEESPFTGGRGLYQICFSTPYTLLTQLCASRCVSASTIGSSPDANLLLLRCSTLKLVEKKVSILLDTKSDDIEVINAKTALTSYIRYFEPVVIKALKLYTTTTDTSVQSQVLNLLSELVQLRVNYNLLDSEQVFIGFVLKQVEFLESGHIQEPKRLISSLFRFLAVLSQERQNCRPIVGIPKLIQMSDGLNASGQPARTHVIPALVPMIEDLFVMRNPSKNDAIKDLEAQREVIVSTLFKLSTFPEILELLTLVVQQSKKDGEERWKKMSRFVVDHLLGLIVKQQIDLDNQISFGKLETLLDLVSPSVFRPIDLILKALFTPPQSNLLDNPYTFHRWISGLLVIIRVFKIHGKEDVVLTRLQELKTGIVGWRPFGLASLCEQEPDYDFAPEKLLAEYLLHTVQVGFQQIVIHMNSPHSSHQNHCEFMVQLMAKYLLYVNHMLQSGSFRRLTRAAIKILKESNEPTSDFDVKVACNFALDFSFKYPCLTLHWANVLMLLDYVQFEDDSFWDKLLSSSNCFAVLQDQEKQLNNSSDSHESPSAKSKFLSNLFKQVPSMNQVLIRRGSLVLLCDYICENCNDAERMAWLLVTFIEEIIRYSDELPIKELINSVHRNQASSSLLLQAINARCNQALTPTYITKVMRCLITVHYSQYGPLLSLLIENILLNKSICGYKSVLKHAEDMALRTLDTLLYSGEDPLLDSASEISEEDLDKLIQKLEEQGNKFPQILSKAKEVKSKLSSQKALEDALAKGSSITAKGDGIETNILSKENMKEEYAVNKEWFISIFRMYCRKGTKDHRAINLMNKLSYDEIMSILNDSQFDIELLADCVNWSSLNMSLDEDSSATSSGPSVFSAIMTNRNNLLKASVNSITQHLNQLVKLLPSPHHAFLSHDEMLTPKEAKHRDRLIDVFSSPSAFDFLCNFAPGFSSFISAYASKKVLAPDLLDTCLRMFILYGELIQFMSERRSSVSTNHLVAALKVIDSGLQCKSFVANIISNSNISYQNSMMCGIHSLVKLYCKSSLISFTPVGFEDNQKSQPDLKHVHNGSIRCAQLVHFASNMVEGDSSNMHIDEYHVPSSIGALLKRIIPALARLPVFNSVALIPTKLWNTTPTWTPTWTGPFLTQCTLPPIDLLVDYEILRQLAANIKIVGWTSRQQFEEMWMALVGAYGMTPATEPVIREEANERLILSCLTIEMISKLLLMTQMEPQAGNPQISSYSLSNASSTKNFYHTRFGEKLHVPRDILIKASNILRSPVLGPNSFSEYPQLRLTVENLREIIGSTNKPNIEPDISPSLSSGSSSSSSTHSPMVTPAMVTHASAQRHGLASSDRTSRATLDIDLNSCIHFIVDLFSQILISDTPPPLIAKSCQWLNLLSDLFNERSQFEWMLNSYLDLQKTAQTSEDELLFEHLILGTCKSIAVLGVDDEPTFEKLRRTIDNGLKNPFLPTRINTLRGLFYLFESRNLLGGKEATILPTVSDYLIRHLGDENLPSSRNEEHVILMWKLSFHLIHTYVEDFADSDFSQKIFNMSLGAISSTKTPVNIYVTVIDGLESLLLHEYLSISDVDNLVRTALDQLKTCPSELYSISILRVVVSSMYIAGPERRKDAPTDPENEEQLLVAMERVSMIFDRLKVCQALEASVICSILSHVLYEFFPSQDVLNKVIAEFLSSQQPYPQHVAYVLFQVFGYLHSSKQQDIIYEWVVMSLNSFTQLEPDSLAFWSLSCFLISASSTSWLRQAFPYVQNRYLCLEDIDRRIFKIVCFNFYRELKTPEHKEAMKSSFEGVSKKNPLYAEALLLFDE